MPVIVTNVPTAPDVGDRLAILGAATTVNVTPLLALPLTVTTTLPVVAPVGTIATMEVALQLVMVVTAVPLNLTVLVPWLDPKFEPAIVTEAPTAPDVGERLVMLGAASKTLGAIHATRMIAIWTNLRATVHLLRELRNIFSEGILLETALPELPGRTAMDKKP